MGKPLVRFCEGPGINEWQKVRAIRHVVVACDEAFNESLIEHLIHDHLKTSVYSKVMEKRIEEHFVRGALRLREEAGEDRGAL
ncbi:MAG TPA: hypothetical protein VGA86_05465, partial [Desulfatiglandales bacterium]